MKNKTIIYKIIAVISIVTIAITGFALANQVREISHQENRDRTSVILEPVVEGGKNTGVVNVYLQMDDGIKTEEQKSNKNETIIEDAASVQSFQIGLDIEATAHKKEDGKEDDVVFEFASNLKEGNEAVKLAQYTYKPSIPDEHNPEIYKGERLNIYFVGTKELNDVNSNETLLIGKLTFNTKALGDNETVRITPIEAPSTIAASVGSTETPIDVHPEEDGVEFILNAKDAEHENDQNGSPNENDATGGGTTNNGGTNGGSGNGGSSTSGQQNGDSELGEKKSNGNFFNRIKTGANHSLTWVIITIVTLIILAFVLIKVRSKMSKHKAKH